MTAPRIYIAGSSKELDRAEEAVRQVRILGYEVAVDWPAAMRHRAAMGLTDVHLTPTERHTIASVDLDGIETSDAAWLLVPSTETTGFWFEAGSAITLKRIGERPRVVIASIPHPAAGRPRFCVFTDQIRDVFLSDAEAVEYLRGMRTRLT